MRFKGYLFIAAILVSLSMASTAFAVELTGLLAEGSEAPASECLLALASGIESAVEQSASPAFTITGPEEISSGIANTYVVSGAPGPVVWSVYGNFGSSCGDAQCGISESGKLTVGSNSCGAVKVAASSQGAVATKEVRVSNGGVWGRVGTSGSSPPSGCNECCKVSGKTMVCSTWIDTRERYTTCGACLGCGDNCAFVEFMSSGAWWCNPPCYSGGDVGCYFGMSSGWRKGLLNQETCEYFCQPKPYNTNDDGDGYNAYGSHDNAVDCDDSLATGKNTYPGADEICGDGIDNNCDGEFDEEGCVPKDGEDGDGDGDGGGGCIPEVCDGVDNDCDGRVDNGVFDLRVSPSEVAPQKTSGNTQAAVIATLHSPAALGGCTIDLEVDADAHLKSGGHDHHGPNDGRPKGTLSNSKISFAAGETEKSVKYTSSEFAGEETVIGTISGSDDKVEAEIDVMVSVLGQMPTSSYWRLTGNKAYPGTNHESNHHVEAAVMGSMMKIAREYYQRTKTTLGINDMSLKWGGGFDIYGNWLEDIKKPNCNQKGHGHCSHRTGTDVDIDRNVHNPVTGQDKEIWCEDDDNLDKITHKHFGKLKCESKGRKHIDFD